MNDLIVWRDKLQELYATKSIYIDKAVQFILALVTFLMINQNIGLMKAVATPVVAVALAVICTFLPPVVTAYVAAGLVIVHLFKLSMGVAAAAALISSARLSTNITVSALVLQALCSILF